MSTTRYSLTLLAGLALGAPALAQQPATPAGRTIQVSAVGQVETTPDEAFVDLAVETVAPTAQAASQENARAMDRLIRALVAAGVPRDDIETRFYTVSPEYARPPRPMPPGEEEPRIRGYRVTNMVTVHVKEISRVGPLIDTALASGANRVGSVRFGVSNPQAVRAQALRQAVEKARAEAETLASALGVQLGQLLDASTAVGGVHPAGGVMRTAAVAEFAGPTPIQPGEQTITASVTLVYRIVGGR